MKSDGLIIALCLICLAAANFPFQSTRATPAEYHIDISTTPANGFLSIDNLKPGDKITSIVQVNNESNSDFNYSVSAKWESGSKTLFNQLKMQIADSMSVKYQGDLNGLKQIPMGEIDGFTSKKLTFTASVPPDIGNEYQHLSTSATFVFQANPLLPPESCFLPPFSNKNFSHQQGSNTPITFQVNGTNVSLALIGNRSTNGGIGKTYFFTLSDKTLKREENYYKAKINNNLPLGDYQAIIYVGGEAVCKKDFKVIEQGNRSNSPKSTE